MSATSALFLLFLVWAAIGVSAALIMGRRGHTPVVWAFVGTVLGPLVIPLMIQAARREPRVAPAPLGATHSSGDMLDVVVGIDGSDEASAALRLVVDLFARIVGRLAIVTVVSYELGSPEQPTPARQNAEALLAEQVRATTERLGREPQSAVLAGRPADALAQFATSGQFDLLVVGSRGRGASKLLMGSVATALARGVGLPVVVVPPSTKSPSATD
jgi:nucleotide-binding universal stress UspA family protein